MNAEEKSNFLAVSVVVKDAAGNVFLRKRVKEPDAGKWELFAGYPLLSERPLEKAIRRILKEKGGIESVDSIVFSGKFYDDPARHPGVACIPLVFVAKISEKPANSEMLRWFSRAELKDAPIALDNKQILQDLDLA